MRGFNLVFASIIEVPVLIVKSVLVDTRGLLAGMVGNCIPATKSESEVPVVADVPDTIEPQAKSADSTAFEEKDDSDYVAPSVETRKRYSK